MKILNLSFWLAILCFGAAPLLQAQQGTTAPPTASTSSVADSDALNVGLDQLGIRRYLLGPGDVLDLRVFGEQQFNGPLVVDDYGNIELPFVDDPIPAQCRTDREIRNDITNALKKYIKEPRVSLRVADRRSRPPAVVFGAVRAAQRFQMFRRMRLLEALAQTGGVTEQAGGTIQVFHTTPLMCPEQPEEVAASKEFQKITDDALQIPFSVYKLDDLKQGKDEANPVIWPGDIVIVQEAAPVYITGAVVAPQGIYKREKLSLTTAIAQVGGLRPGARQTDVRIYRQKPGALKPEEIKVDLAQIKNNKKDDIELQAYDVIEVPEKTPTKLESITRFLMGTAFNSVNSVTNVVGYKVIY